MLSKKAIEKSYFLITLLYFFCIYPLFSTDLPVMQFFCQDFPPFTYEEEGVLKGPFIDIAHHLARRIDVEAEILLLPWRRALQRARLGEGQVLLAIGWSLERSSWLYYSDPLVETEYGFFVRRADPLLYLGPVDMKGYTVSVYGPSNTSQRLKELVEGFSDIEIDLLPDDTAAFQNLAQGRVDAVFSNRDVGFVMARRLGIASRIRYAGRAQSLSYYIGFLKEEVSLSLFRRCNEALRAMKEDGSLEKIFTGCCLSGQ